jgi:glyoxylase-like metal-dependent hydrolase (beta-lactamase superfamily II)
MLIDVSTDLQVLVRGWLHGNVTLLPDAVIDTGYFTGVAEIAREGGTVLLTHAHSDHAGGVAKIGGDVWASAKVKAMTTPWDPRALWLTFTGQQMPAFTVDHVLGDSVTAGGRDWRVIETGGHATGGVSFFDGDVLVTGDALWEDGFGIIDPWIDGNSVFDDAKEALDRLAELRPSVVIPGHGKPFADHAGAVERAQGRLAYLRQRPDRLKAQILRNFVGFFRLMYPDTSPEELAQRTRVVDDAHPL